MPWYVNRTLTADDQEQVNKHIPECLSCQEEISFLEGVQESLQVQPLTAETVSGEFDRMLERIGQAESRYPWMPPSFTNIWHRLTEIIPPFPQLAPAISVVLIGVMVYWLAPTFTNEDAAYETLSSGELTDVQPLILEINTRQNMELENLRLELASVLTDATLEKSEKGRFLLHLAPATSPGEMLEILDTLRSYPSVLSLKTLTDSSHGR